MKFKELKDNEKKLAQFSSIYKDSESYSWDERMATLMEMCDRSERTVRKWAKKLGLKEKVEIESEELKEAKSRVFNEQCKRFFITWGQCNTPAHERFFRNMEAYAKELDAEIHVIAGRYKNPTSVFTRRDANNDERWDAIVRPYLDANRHDIHPFVSIMSDVKIQPTAVNPMTGMSGMSGVNSCVFGGPKMQMEMIPVLEGEKPKMMVMSGACTVENYTDSKAGKKGEFHHNLGFAVVEIKDEEIFFIRQVTAKSDGSFTDLIYDVKFEGERTPIIFNTIISEIEWKQNNFNKEPFNWVGKTIIKKISKIDAIVLGDIHYGHHDQQLLDTTIDFMDVLKPKHVILHDVFDGYSISHHEMKDPFAQYGKEIRNENDLGKEVNEMIIGLRPFEKFKNVVIVRSNHDDFVDRWLKNEDWRKAKTPKNSLLYMNYSAMLLSQYARNEVKGIIPELINLTYPDFITLGRSDSYKVNGWELGQHGDMGSNGSRGSLQQFRKLNTKLVVGHYHSPGRKDNVCAVGTSTKLRVGYNLGPSSWLQSHVLIHKNGKPQHINFINGEFTTLKWWN